VTGQAAAVEGVPLERSSGESKGETVFRGRRGPYAYVVYREYEGGPWTWIISERESPIAMGDADDHRTALVDLGAELDTLEPPPPERKVGGLVGLFGRLLWGDDGA
jgi:hypothetical protein